MVGLFLVPELDDLHAVAERSWCLSSVLEVSHSLHSHPAGKSSPLRKSPNNDRIFQRRSQRAPPSSVHSDMRNSSFCKSSTTVMQEFSRGIISKVIFLLLVI